MALAFGMAKPSSSTISPIICALAFSAKAMIMNIIQENLFTLLFLLNSFVCKVIHRYQKKQENFLLFNIFLLILRLCMERLPILPTLIGTGFGIGFWPWGPGSAGALLGVLSWYTLSCCVSSCMLPYLTITSIILFTILGTWATRCLIPFWGEDPKRIVIDEIIGVWIPLVATPVTDLWLIALSFVLFRLFDIIKPFGIKWLDNKKGAFFVMADDILAGLYSLAIIIIVRWAI